MSQTREQRRVALREWRAKNPDRVRAHNRTQTKRHGAKIGAYKKAWREERVDEQRAAARTRYADNPVLTKERARAWNRAHPGTVNALLAKRRAAQKQRTPRWLNPEQMRDIQAKYEEAARLTRTSGVPHHVDHVVPLQGRRVSGLHVSWNLQILTGSANCVKGNTWPT